MDRATNLLDIRRIIGGLLGVYGVILLVAGIVGSDADKNKKQHMTTFTIGLGVNGQLGFSDDYLNTTGLNPSIDYNKIIGNTLNWPKPVGDQLTTIDDLWHAAVNGHGQYFSAKNPNSLVSGLRQALAGVTARDAAGAAAATSNLEPTPGDNFAYVANYRTQKWDGDIVRQLTDYIAIPAKSPGFDKDWAQHGYIDTVLRNAASWVEAQKVEGLQL